MAHCCLSDEILLVGMGAGASGKGAHKWLDARRACARVLVSFTSSFAFALFLRARFLYARALTSRSPLPVRLRVC